MIKIHIKCSGSSEIEIDAKEHTWNLKFPKAYREFLKICGQDTGKLFFGKNVELLRYNYINEAGRESYKAVFDKECPSKFVFILEHHNYSYYYFNNSGDQNPDLFIFVHGDEILHEKVGKLNDVLSEEIDRYIVENENLTL